MIYLYIARLKCLFRNKVNIFWSYLFPIILCSCFFFAFGKLWNNEDFNTIPIAYVSQGESEDTLKTLMKEVEISKGKPVFKMNICKEAKAKELLNSGKIKAYIVNGLEPPKLHVKENGIYQTIVKSFVDSYKSKSQTMETILKNNPNAIKQGLLKDIMKFKSYAKEASKENKPDVILIYFYALMAYTCLYASNWGMEEVNNIQADLSEKGARISISPINKMRLFICNLSAAFTAQMGSIVLLFLYMYYVIKINFGSHIMLMFFTCMLGSLAGLMLGAAVGILVKKSAQVKDAILTVIVLGGSFLSGLMVQNMKYLVATKCPILGYINPVNLVTDALYSLYYYDTFERYTINMLLLSGFTVVLGIVSFIGVGRKNYASI